MRETNKETHVQSLTGNGCNLTGTGKATNQLFDGIRGTIQNEPYKSYDYSFQCQQFDDRISLYVICSGNRFSDFAKEKLVAEILFGQFNNNSPEDVKCVLRQAFASLERDYLHWIDEYLTRQSENGGEIKETTDLLFNGIHIAVALIYHSKLYTCNVGQCRIILCKTDNNNVLRAVQMSADYDNTTNTNNSIGETILSRLEIVGPIPLNETHRFLVLMSFGLCKTLDDVYSDENNINRELIQAIVQQFRVQPSLAAVAQTVIERIVTQHYANYMKHHNNDGDRQHNGRADLTLMIRNFNFSLPNEGHPSTQSQVTNLTNTMTGSIEPGSQTDTVNSNNSNSSTTTSASNLGDSFDKNFRISPYVDFMDYYKNVEAARRNGTLPTNIQFN